jgi:GPH family glycoside/pentoside/hexuronide:cation symporter
MKPESEPKTPASDQEFVSPPTAEAESESSGDASRGEVAIYAFGNVEGAIADRFPEILQNILIVVAQVNPLLLGLVMGVKTLWDGLMDPIMAHISDNTKTRFGRRRPYILIGGVGRCLFLIPFIALIPIGDQATSNQLMEAQKNISEATQLADKNYLLLAKAADEFANATPATQQRLVDVLEGRPPESWITNLISVFSKSEDQSILIASKQSVESIDTNLPTLEKDFEQRQATVHQLEQDFDQVKMEGESEESESYLIASGLLLAAEDKLKNTENLLLTVEPGKAKSIANGYAVRYLLTTYNGRQDAAMSDLAMAQAASDATLAELGLATVPLLVVPERHAPKAREVNPPFYRITEGFKAFVNPANFQQRSLIIYLLIAYIIFATLSTINMAPYYALGIELSPSYEGRTQVVIYRSMVNKIAGLVAPWVPVFCFSLLFATAFDALFWVAVFACVIGIPSTVLMFFKTKERTRATIKKSGERANLFQSMFQIGREKEFLRILFLFVFIGMVNGLFAQIGFFLNVYWVTGSALSGAMLGAQVAMIAWAISLLLLPIIKWACNKFQKHRVMQFAIIWMSIGTALNWVLMDPQHPEYQYLLPFFFSVGISAVYTVLPTMMADVTDLDELQYGVRREGMFGAVMGFLMKLIGTITPIGAGLVLVLSGFDAGMEYQQNPQTITNMRLMYSIVPAVILLFSIFAVFKYPLTRERVAEIKAQLKARHAVEDAAETATA